MKKSRLKIVVAILAVALVAAMSLVMFAACVDKQDNVPRCTVTFMNGDELFDTQVVLLGQKYKFPEKTPEQEQPDDDHELQFVGWTLDDNYYEHRSDIIEEPDFVVADITIYAAFKKVLIADTPGQGADKEYEVEFRMPVGEDFGDKSGIVLDQFTQKVKRYHDAVLPTVDQMPQIKGYHFTEEWTGGTLTNVRGRRRVTAVYETNVYTLKLHYLGQTEERSMEYRAPINLSEERPQVDEAFTFEGWYTDADFQTQATLAEMPDGEVELYAKYLVDFATATISQEGSMVYGDAQNKLYVSGLKECEGLVYTFAWTVNGQAGDAAAERNCGVRDAGAYNVQLHIYANYKNGVLVDEGDAKTSGNSTEFVFTVQKATLTAVVTLNKDSVVYGSAAPTPSIVYSGFVFDDTAESAQIAQQFVYKMGDIDVTGTNLHVGSYRVETVPQTNPNYQFAAIEAPQFTVTPQDLRISAAVTDYVYGTPLTFVITFDQFVFDDGESVLGEHWFTLNGEGNYVGEERLHVGAYSAQLHGYASNDYNVILPEAFQFSVSKRPGSAQLAAEGGIYGVTPAISYTLDNVLPEDEARFSPVYTYKRNNNLYNLERFVVGNYSVTATFNENGFEDYQPLTVEGAEFSISQKPIAVSVVLNNSYVYGQSIVPTLAYEDAFAFGESAQTPGVVEGNVRYTYCTASDGKPYNLARFAVNDYTVVASGLTSANYAFSFPTTEFSVTKKGLTLTVHLDKESILYGEEPQVAIGDGYINGVSYDGFVEGETAYSVFATLPKVFYLDSNNQQATQFHAGAYTATTSADPHNYNVTVRTVALTVNRRTLSINVTLPQTSMFYGNKPVSTQIVYEAEGFDGFVNAAEKNLYTASAYVIYKGVETYTQAQLGDSDVKMIAGSYKVSVEDIDAAINGDYDVTYGYPQDGIAFSVTPAPLNVKLSCAQTIVYGTQPEVAIAYKGFAYKENEEQLFGENARKIVFCKKGTETPYDGRLVVDEYIATLKGIANPNYTVTLENCSLTIVPKTLKVKISADDFTYGDKVKPVPTLSYEGFAYEEDDSVVNGAPIYAYQRSAIANGAKTDYSADFFDAGYYNVRVSGLDADNYVLDFGSGKNFTVAKRNFTATVTANSITYGDEADYDYQTDVLERDKESFAFRLALAYRSGNVGAYQSYDPQGYTYFQAGNYRVSLEYNLNSNYNNFAVQQANFTVSKRSFTATIAANDITYGDEANYSYATTDILDDDKEGFNFHLTVGYRADGSGVFAPYVAENYKHYQAGEYQVALEYNHNSNYEEIDVEPVNFTVAKRSFTATVTAKSVTYGEEANYSYEASNILDDDKDGFNFRLTVGYRSDESGEFSPYVAQKYKHYQAGEYQVALEYNHNSNYEEIDVEPVNFTVAKRSFSATITADSVTYGEEANYSYEASNILDDDKDGFNFRLTVGYRSDERGEFAPYVAENYAHYQAGEYQVALEYNHNSNYEEIDVEPVNFTVAKRSFTATVTAKNITYGDKEDYSYSTSNILADDEKGFNFRLTVGYRSDGNGEFKTYAAQNYAHYQAGEYQVALEYNHNANYKQLDQKPTATFSVQKKDLNVKVTADSLTYGGTAEPRISQQGLVDGDEALLANPQFAYTGNYRGGIFHAGAYTVTITGVISNNYNITIEEGKFTVQKAQITVEVQAEGYTYGEKYSPTVSLKYGQFVHDDAKAALGDAAYTYKRSATQDGEKTEYAGTGLFAAGYYTIGVSGLASDDYDITLFSKDIVINKAKLTVSVSVAGFKYDGVTKPAPKLSYSGFVNNETADIFKGQEVVYTYNGNVREDVFHAGEYTATADGLDSENYEITYQQGNFTISQRSVAIRFNSVWATYADDPTSYNWYTLDGDEVLNEELTFAVSFTKNGDVYIANEKYFSVGEYVATVSYQPNPDYVVKHNNEELDGSVSREAFTIAKKQLTLTVQDSAAWSQRDSWAKTPSINDERFTFEGFIELKDKQTISAGRYTDADGEMGSHFAWKGQYFVKLDGVDVTGNFNFKFVINITLDDSDFVVKVPQNARFTYDGQPHSFEVEATASGIDNSKISYSYSTSEDGEYTSEPIKFTNWKQGGYTVWYKVSAENAKESKGSFTVSVEKAVLTAKKVESVTAVYDGNNKFKAITKDNVDGLMGDDDIVNVAYSQSGTGEYGNAWEIVGATNLGAVTVYFKVSAGDNYTEATGSYTVSIAKATVEVPTIARKTYNKGNQIAEVPTSDRYTVTTNAGGKDATSVGYDVVLTLNDADNYKWADNTVGAVKTLKFYIDKATVNRPAAVKKDYTYNGEAQTFELDENFDGETMDIKDNVQKNADTYYVTVSLHDKNNYKWADDKTNDCTFTFTIAKAPLTIKKVDNVTATYDGNNKFKPITKDNVDGLKGDDNITVKYSKSDNGAYGNAWEIVGATTLAVTVYFKVSAGDNYTEATGFYTVAISPKKLTVKLPGNINAVYDKDAEYSNGITVEGILGNVDLAKVATVAYKYDASSNGYDNYNSSVAPKFKNAIEGLTVTVTVTSIDPNYTFEGGAFEGSYTVNISKKGLARPAAVEKDYTYDGNNQTFALDGNFDDALMDIEGNKRTAAGANEVKVSLKDKGNYKWADDNENDCTFTFTIAKAALTVNGVDNVTATYDGSDKFIAITKDNANVQGLLNDEAITVTYSKSKNGEYGAAWAIVNVSESATVWYKVDAGDNYEIALGSYEVTISPKELTVTLPGNINAEYDINKEYNDGIIVEGILGNVALAKVATVTYSYNASSNGYTDYSNSVAPKFKNAITGLTVTVTVESIDPNYTFENGTFEGSYTVTIEQIEPTVGLPDELDSQSKEQGITIEEKDGLKQLHGTYNANNQGVNFASTIECGNKYSDAKVEYALELLQPAGIRLAADLVWTEDIESIVINAAGNYRLHVKVSGDNYIEVEKTFDIVVAKAQATLDVSGITTEYTYNGEEQTVVGEAIAKGLKDVELAGIGTITYSNNTFRDVPVGGTFVMTVTLSEGDNYLGAEETVTITVHKLAINHPTASQKEYIYNGDEQEYKPVGFNAATMDIENNVQIGAGTYYVTVSLKNTANYEWADGAPETFTFTIAKATVDRPTVDATKFTYNGAEQEYKPGNFDDALMDIEGNKRTAAGANEVKVSLKDKGNYKWADDNENDCTFTFTIAKAALTVNGVDNVTATYDGSNKFIAITKDNANVQGLLNDEAITVTYSKSKNGEYGAAWAIVNVSESATVWYKVDAGDNYEIATGSYTVTVNQATVERPTVDATKFTYNGDEQEYVPVGFDAALMNIEGNKQTNAGNHDVIVTLKDTTNYRWADGEPETFTFTINKATLTVEIEPELLEPSYDGNTHFIDLIGKINGLIGADKDKLKVSYTFNPEEGYQEQSLPLIYAGKYEVYYSITVDDNYEVIKSSYIVTIAKATVDRPTVDATKFTYNGAEQEYKPGNFDDATMDIEGNKRTAAGANEVKVSLKDKGNYKWADGEENDVISFTFTIAKAQATLDVSGITTEYTYDGQEHTVIGAVAKGLEGIELAGIGTIAYSNNTFRGVPDGGTFVMTVTLSEGSNYLGAEQKVTITVLPKKLTVTLPGNIDAVYDKDTEYNNGITVDGKPDNLSLADIAEVTYAYNASSNGYINYNSSVAPTFKNAITGLTVTVTVTSKDRNYTFGENGTFTGSYTVNIAKAERTVDNLPTIPEQVLKLGVCNCLQDVIFDRFGAPEGLEWVDPETELKVGTNSYDVTIKGDENYNDYTGLIFITARKQKLTVRLSKVGGFEMDFNGTTINFADISGNYPSTDIEYTLLDENGQELTEAELETIKDFAGPTISCEGTINQGGTYKVIYGYTINENRYFESENGVYGYTWLKVKSVDVGGTLYTIEDALAIAAGGTIIVKYNTSFATAEVAELAGYKDNSYYTIKDGITLLLPYDGANGINSTTGASGSSTFGKKDTNGKVINRKIELYVPANITIVNNGNIVIGGVTTGAQAFAGGTAGDYAQITLGANAIINSYGDILAYGFIVEESDDNGSQVIMNKGNITMPFIVVEHRGGSVFYGCYKDLKGSPFNSFYMQNVMAKLTIMQSATLYGHANLYAGSQDNVTDIKLVGKDSDAMICLTNAASKFVVKYKDQVITTDIYGSFTLNAMELSVKAVITAHLSTEKVLFPISWHFNIALHTFENGNNATVTTTGQSFKLMPGSSLTVDQGVTLNAKDIIVYDGDYVANSVGGGVLYQNVAPKDKQGNLIPAKLIVNGTLNVQNIGGSVDSEQDGAVLNVQNSCEVTSYELLSTSGSNLTASVKWEEYKKALTIAGINSPARGCYVFNGNVWQQSTKKITFTVNFHDGDEVSQETYTVYVIDGTYTLIYLDKEAPSKQYYKFSGWYFDKENIKRLGDSEYHVTDNQIIDVYAGWEKIEYDIVYIVDCAGEYSNYTNTNAATWHTGDAITLVEAIYNGAVEGLTFKGWFADAKYEYPISEISDANIEQLLHEGIIVVFGYFENANKEYTVEFQTNAPAGYDNLPAMPTDITITVGQTLGENFPSGDMTVHDFDVTKQYYFGGWEANGKKVTADTEIDASYLTDGKLVVKAVWNEKVKVNVTVTATGKSGNLLKKGSDVTASVTITFSNQDGSNTISATGKGGDRGIGDHTGQTETKNETYYLKPGQSYTITEHTGTVSGSSEGVADENNMSITITVSNS